MTELGFGLPDLADLRRLVTSAGIEAGLSLERAGELAFAVNEVATNAIVHGRPPRTLRIRSAGGEIVCEVTDAGGGIADTSAGRLAPPADAVGGRGLWLTRLLCDAVEIRNGAGCTVSLHVVAAGASAPTG